MQTKHALLTYRYDLDSTTYLYPKLVGISGNPWSGPIQGPGPIETSGSSTTVTGVATNNAFTLLGVGDVLFVRRPDGTTDVRTIMVRTDANTVTVDSAVNWTGGFHFMWKDLKTGTGVTDGWVDVEGASSVLFVVDYAQGDLDGGLNIQFEGKTAVPGAAPVLLTAEVNLATAAAGTLAGRTSFTTTSPWAAVRVGLQVDTTDTSDAGANIEHINASITAVFEE